MSEHTGSAPPTVPTYPLGAADPATLPSEVLRAERSTAIRRHAAAMEDERWGQAARLQHRIGDLTDEIDRRERLQLDHSCTSAEQTLAADLATAYRHVPGAAALRWDDLDNPEARGWLAVVRHIAATPLTP